MTLVKGTLIGFMIGSLICAIIGGQFMHDAIITQSGLIGFVGCGFLRFSLAVKD